MRTGPAFRESLPVPGSPKERTTEDEHCRLCGIMVASSARGKGAGRMTSYPFFKVKKDGKSLYLRIQAILGFELLPLSKDRDDRVCVMCYRTIPRVEDAMKTVEKWEDNVFNEYKKRRYIFSRTKRRFILEPLESFKELPPLPPPPPPPETTPSQGIHKDGRKPRRKRRKEPVKGDVKKQAGANDKIITLKDSEHSDQQKSQPSTSRKSRPSTPREDTRKLSATHTCNDGVIENVEMRERLTQLLQKWDEYRKQQQSQSDDVMKSYKGEVSKLQHLLEEQQAKANTAEHEVRLCNLKIDELEEQCNNMKRQICSVEERYQTVKDERDRLAEDLEKNSPFLMGKELAGTEMEEEYKSESLENGYTFLDFLSLDKEICKYRALMETVENGFELDGLRKHPKIEPNPNATLIKNMAAGV